MEELDGSGRTCRKAELSRFVHEALPQGGRNGSRAGSGPGEALREPRGGIRSSDPRADEKVEAHLAASASTDPAAPVRRDKGEDGLAQKLQRMEATHRAIREDIEKMHGRLETGIGGPDLDALAKFLEELDGSVKADKDSHSILPRARYAISEQLQARAGELAIARLADLLQREKLGWPDPTQGGPGVTAEELERSRRRRLAEIQEAFLGAGLKRTAERMRGIVSAWASDYPQRGSPLWEESVLEAIAAGGTPTPAGYFGWAWTELM